jgi:hypothetical protein
MPPKVSLRLRLAVLASVLAFGLVLPACGGNDDEGGAAKDSVAATEFVGTLADGTAVAVAVGDGRKVTAFVCDGRKVAEWFTGSLEDENRINLDSLDGDAPLAAEVQGDELAGVVTVKGGIPSFTISKSTNEAGLYRTAVLADGTVTAESEAGSRLEGRLDDEGDLVGTVTLPDGETLRYRTEGPSGGEPGLYRVIILPGGKAVGARQRGVRATANAIQSVPTPTAGFKISWPG